MEITRHAVNRYLERVLGLNRGEIENATKEQRHDAREEIRDVAEDPVIIYRGEQVNEEEGSAPIYIKGDIAIPVDKHNEMEGEIAVPTTYKADTFTEKIYASAGD